MSSVNTQNNKKWVHLKRVLTGVVLLFVVGCAWTTFDLRSFDRRLDLGYEVDGPAVELQNITWESIWVGPIRQQALWVKFEVVNPSEETLEIIQIGNSLQDPFGNRFVPRPADFEKFYWGNVGQGRVLQPRETRPMEVLLPLSDIEMLRPLFWTKSTLTVSTRPANPVGLTIYWRSYNIHVNHAGYRDDGAYELQGNVKDFVLFVDAYRAEGGKGIRVYTVVTTYNNLGELTGLFSVPVPVGRNGDFKMVVNSDRIESYKIWFAELRP